MKIETKTFLLQTVIWHPFSLQNIVVFIQFLIYLPFLTLLFYRMLQEQHIDVRKEEKCCFNSIQGRKVWNIFFSFELFHMRMSQV